MITLQCQLEFQNKQDKEIVLDLMRRFSSAMRYAYKRLLEGNKRKDLKKDLSKLFNINTRYSDDAIFLAQSMVASCEKRGQNPKKLIFGSRKLFEQLKKNHLTGKRRKQLKTKWKESRQGNLYSRCIDVNAYPFHLALAFASKDGNLEKYQSVSLNELLESNSEKRQYLEWQIAHRIIKIAKEGNKAIAIENLQKLPKGKRGDGFAKLRIRLQKWSYKRLLEKIEILAKRNGIEIRKVNPAYTSVIGKLKYAPQYNIDKDIAGAFVIARRGLGYKEKLPKNYKELLNDTDFLSYTIAKIEDNITKLKQKSKEEINEYKRDKLKTLQKHVSRLTSHVSRLESGKSETASQQPVNQRKEQVRGLPTGRHKSWQVLSIALAFCCLERSYRDFSPLKRVIISKDWTAVANRLVPVLGAGTMTSPKYRLSGSEMSEMADYKYPDPSCAN
jgi:transposase, putative, N-terminal domain